MLPQRIDVLATIPKEFPDDPVVFTCGATSREMAHVDRRPNHLYVVDSMGIISSVVLGLSLSMEESSVTRVVGVEGDGGMLMNLNALSTIGYLQPKKLLLIVLDNESYASTGGQPTFTDRLDLGRCGRVLRAEDLEGERPGRVRAGSGLGRGGRGARLRAYEDRPGQYAGATATGRPSDLGQHLLPVARPTPRSLTR